MSSNTIQMSLTPRIPSSGIQRVQKRSSDYSDVRKYTDYLIQGISKPFALQSLLKMNCSIHVFVSCQTEEVLHRMYTNISELQELVERLKEKLATLRKQETYRLENYEKPMDHTKSVHVSSQKEAIEMYKKQQEEKNQMEFNKLFSDALEATRRTSVELKSKKVDYSKYKITKRTKKPSTSSTSSNSSSNSSSPNGSVF
ncbi:hypothetical protein CAEBREN_24508 [Caenorhabditis brenneri]|uniref:Uncharacterized protein n=1 Tax=Caenorhabditis brenneri TaxID=135651 RepID=G0MZ38_CAEBE|nr:hypothetical protein CAEBREN_24508 [Caenorhabditis brenneri]